MQFIPSLAEEIRGWRNADHGLQEIDGTILGAQMRLGFSLAKVVSKLFDKLPTGDAVNVVASGLRVWLDNMAIHFPTEEKEEIAEPETYQRQKRKMGAQDKRKWEGRPTRTHTPEWLSAIDESPHRDLLLAHLFPYDNRLPIVPSTSPLTPFTLDHVWRLIIRNTLPPKKSGGFEGTVFTLPVGLAESDRSRARPRPGLEWFGLQRSDHPEIIQLVCEPPVTTAWEWLAIICAILSGIRPLYVFPLDTVGPLGGVPSVDGERMMDAPDNVTADALANFDFDFDIRRMVGSRCLPPVNSGGIDRLLAEEGRRMTRLIDPAETLPTDLAYQMLALGIVRVPYTLRTMEDGFFPLGDRVDMDTFLNSPITRSIAYSKAFQYSFGEPFAAAKHYGALLSRVASMAKKLNIQGIAHFMSTAVWTNPRALALLRHLSRHLGTGWVVETALFVLLPWQGQAVLDTLQILEARQYVHYNKFWVWLYGKQGGRSWDQRILWIIPPYGPVNIEGLQLAQSEPSGFVATWTLAMAEAGLLDDQLAAVIRSHVSEVPMFTEFAQTPDTLAELSSTVSNARRTRQLPSLATQFVFNLGVPTSCYRFTPASIASLRNAYKRIPRVPDHRAVRLAEYDAQHTWAIKGWNARDPASGRFLFPEMEDITLDTYPIWVMYDIHHRSCLYSIIRRYHHYCYATGKPLSIGVRRECPMIACAADPTRCVGSLHYGDATTRELFPDWIDEKRINTADAFDVQLCIYAERTVIVQFAERSTAILWIHRTDALAQLYFLPRWLVCTTFDLQSTPEYEGTYDIIPFAHILPASTDKLFASVVGTLINDPSEMHERMTVYTAYIRECTVMIASLVSAARGAGKPVRGLTAPTVQDFVDKVWRRLGITAKRVAEAVDGQREDVTIDAGMVRVGPNVLNNYFVNAWYQLTLDVDYNVRYMIPLFQAVLQGNPAVWVYVVHCLCVIGRRSDWFKKGPGPPYALDKWTEWDLLCFLAEDSGPTSKYERAWPTWDDGTLVTDRDEFFRAHTTMAMRVRFWNFLMAKFGSSSSVRALVRDINEARPISDTPAEVDMGEEKEEEVKEMTDAEKAKMRPQRKVIAYRFGSDWLLHASVWTDSIQKEWSTDTFTPMNIAREEYELFPWLRPMSNDANVVPVYAGVVTIGDIPGQPASGTKSVVMFNGHIAPLNRMARIQTSVSPTAYLERGPVERRVKEAAVAAAAAAAAAAAIAAEAVAAEVAAAAEVADAAAEAAAEEAEDPVQADHDDEEDAAAIAQIADADAAFVDAANQDMDNAE